MHVRGIVTLQDGTQDIRIRMHIKISDTIHFVVYRHLFVAVEFLYSDIDMHV